MSIRQSRQVPFASGPSDRAVPSTSSRVRRTSRWTFNPGESVLVDCGSITVTVEAGDGVTGQYGNSSIGIPVGVTARFDVEGDSLSVVSVSGGPVTVTVELSGDDVLVTFPDGTSGTVGPGGDVTGVTGDGVTLIVGGVEVEISEGGGLNLIQGASGSNTITGTPGDDLIIDTAGSNTIKGQGGNDTIVAGAGNDNIDGGDGNDVIQAGGGNNIVKGGKGDDQITAGSGNDNFDGGVGWDTCSADGGKNTIKGCEVVS